MMLQLKMQEVEIRGEARGEAKGRAEGRMEGVTETYLSSIKSLMEEMSLPAEWAMSVLRIPEEDWPKYLKLLK